jgi:hypothetical protein
MKERVVYIVSSSKGGEKFSNMFLPKEFYLIKTLLNEGHVITLISRQKLSEKFYKILFT